MRELLEPPEPLVKQEAETEPIPVKRTNVRLLPDSSRVLIRPFFPPSESRINRIVGRVMALAEPEVSALLKHVMKEFSTRHVDIEPLLLRHFERIRSFLLTDLEPSRERKLLLGAYFTSEYALESAALFNPSIMLHPDQSGLPAGSVRFIMSLRATGEGHISSIEFRSGTIDREMNIKLDPVTRFITEPEIIPNPAYEKRVFHMKLHEMGCGNECSNHIIGQLGETFTLSELQRVLSNMRRADRLISEEESRTLERIRWLAFSNYEVQFSPRQGLSERIIFPYSPSQIKGLEDARFVRFVDDDGTVTYYSTYTAYDGRSILPELIATRDFLRFQVATLNGKAVQNKGMALFPRRIDGEFAMLSRQDNENIFIMFSPNIHFWQTAEIILRPTYSWEYVQLGNCGSPLETEKGWLVLTHGVGPMRRYCIGAILLDRDNPRKVIGRLAEPLLEPSDNEREGYVPNVVYTCGALRHGQDLVIPYAMADYATNIAIVSIEAVLKRMG